MESAKGRVERELARIDLLLHREVMRLRARYDLSLDEFRGLYISDKQVDELLRGLTRPFDADALTAQAEAIRLRNEEDSAALSSAAWQRAVAEYQLAPVEQDLLFLALAPELDNKYETLYAYLNNDVSRKFPTRNLARRLFFERGSGAVDRALAPGSVLFRSGLIAATTAGFGFNAGIELSKFLLAPEAAPAPPLRNAGYLWLPAPDWTDVQTARYERAAELLKSGATLVFVGQRGAGRLAAAYTLCYRAGLGLLVLNAREVKLEGETIHSLARSVTLHARLQGMALYIENGEMWFEGEGRAQPNAQLLLHQLENLPLCFACESHANWRELLGHRRCLALPFPALPFTARVAQWGSAIENSVKAIAGAKIEVPPAVIQDLARQFVFTRGQIASAVQDASDALTLEPGASAEALLSAARNQSVHSLGKLARKISTTHRWSDLVLPPATAILVREAAAAIRNRGLVYEDWRMAPASGSTGLNVLFSGASGTGKTMSAGIIAAECGLDLFRIDLSGVVSKYIGETEKNLDRIFTAARASNAILFFDEADAMFGKRSEVQDARDRYANIEVSYLLQKLEEHDGVIILASNLSRNIDEAFSRRIQFHVEFPMPAEPHREKLWRGMFPPQAPLADDVDFAFLARQFQMTGGQIRTVSVDAAFVAAADGRRITMPLIVKAVARHFVKQGRMPTSHEFQHYFPLLTGGR